MEKNRSTKIVAIAALFIAVIGLSIGFAAFSSTLTVQSGATVTPADNDWNLQFTSTNDSVTPQGFKYNSANSDYSTELTNNTNPVFTNNVVANSYNGGFGATTASITASNTASTISGVHAYFTEPGQRVTYTFKVSNLGSYRAYLKSVTFMGATTEQGGTQGSNSSIYCVPGEDEDHIVTNLDPANSGTSACAGISYNIQIGDGAQSETMTTYSSNTTVQDSTGLAPSNGEATVVVTITYANGATRADGPFTVNFGDIVVGYSSIRYTSGS